MYKTIKYIKVVALTVLVSIASSCTDKFEDMNVSPNEPLEVPTPYLLTTSQKMLMDYIWDEWHNGRFGMPYAQYWAQNVYTDEDRYQLRQGVNNNYWSFYYAGAGATAGGGGIKDLQQIIDLVTENPEEYSVYGDPENQIAVARILKAWMFQIITDVWGDVPYFEAFQGAENRSPAYTPQAEIYADLLKELKEASEQINVKAGTGFTSGDIIYGGNMEKWKKFANSLRLRVAIRMADKEPEVATQAISDAVTSGVFTSNADNALFRYLNEVPSNNPLNEDRKTRDDFSVAKNLIDLLLEYSDPRIDYYAEERVNGGGYVGRVYGQSQENANAVPMDNVSQPSMEVLAADAPGVYMDYAEVEFIIAEAIQRGYVTGSVAEHYNKGIKASMEYWAGLAGETIPEAEIVNYYTNIAPFKAANWKQSIGEQKWIALYMQGIQGWTEWRRLDFTGVLTLPVDGVLAGSGQIPVRITYPTNEQTTNRSNYQSAVARQGEDVLDTKLWWDVY